MDTAQWPQGSGVVQLPMEGDGNSGAAVVDHQRNIVNTNNINNKAISSAPRPQKPQAINCPRCNSTHTKFCYYNNYSLSQPRYFCKTCRRYWTEGGSLRNVPVGGGSRKNKRSSVSKKLPENTINSHHNPNNIKIFHEGQDLNLAYPLTNSSYINPTSGMVPHHEFVEFTNPTTSSHPNFSQFLKSAGVGGGGGRGFSSFMSMINPVSDPNSSGLLYSSSISGSGLPFQEFSKTSTGVLNFSLNHHHHHHHQLGFGNSGNQGGYGISSQAAHDEENNDTSTNHGKLFNFPIEDLKQPADHVVTTSTAGTTTHKLMERNGGSHHQENDQFQSSGLIWNNGDLGTGASW